MNMNPNRSTMTVTQFALRVAAAIAAVALGTGTASAECSQKARALDKCPPPPHAVAKSTFTGHVAGTTPLGAHQHAHPITKIRKTGPVPGPSPIAHADKNALNPQPIPPGHPLHSLPPVGELRDGGGH